MKTKPTIKRNHKVKQFKLTEEEKELLSANDESLKSMVVSDLQKQINNLVERLEKMKTEEDSKSATTRKNIIIKLKKFKKELKDDNSIKKRVNMLKLKKRKLKSLNSKVSQTLDKIKLQKVRCLKCRRRGHLVADCKFEAKEEENKEEVKPKEETKKVLCYNCGSSEHNLYGCSTPVNYSNLPFAECFVCKEKGHLSSACPKSDHGIYIRGGSCFICNEKTHLAKNCPQKQIEVAKPEKKKPVKKTPTRPLNKKIIKNKK